MEIRYLPRQLGRWGRSIIAGRGKGMQYEARPAVTDAEVSRMKNSKLTPYRHKPDKTPAPSQAPHESHTNNIEGRIAAHTAAAAGIDRAIRQSSQASAAYVEATAPAAYRWEPDGGRGLPGSIGGSIRTIAQGGVDEYNNPRRAADTNPALGTDSDGSILFKDDIISYIKEELERRRKERLPLELQWQLNSNFYDGNQYCDINPYSQEIRQVLPCREWEQHEAFNRIAPLIETRVANLKKINHAMSVKPATNETDDWQKARVSTALLQHTQQKLGFNGKKDTAVLWGELAGTCFWLAWWDSTKGEAYAVEETDFGGAVRERKVYEGDIDYGLLTPYEVYPESIFKQTVADQRSIIIEQVKSVDEIENLYGVTVDGTEVDSFTLTPVPAAGGHMYETTVLTMTKAKISNCEKVITYFERPSAAFPNGRMAIIIGDSELVYYGFMPYADIPIIRTVCKERAGQFFGKSVIEELIPLQRAYNKSCNDISEWISRLKSPQHMVLQGSLDIDEYEEHANEPGAVIVFRDPTYPPKAEQVSQMTGEVFTLKYDLERQMEYVAAVSQLMVFGQLPAGVTSGVAIESLREIDNTRLALTGDYIRAAVRDLAKLWLSIYKQYASTYRVIRYTGKNDIGGAIVWSNQDITSYDVEFTTENELMQSSETQWARVLQLFEAGIHDEALYSEVIERIREFIKTGSHDGEQSINELHEQTAAREFVFLREGALPEIKATDDHKIHALQHLRELLQLEFQQMKQDSPATYEYALAHWQEHVAALQQAAMAAQMAQMAPQIQ